MRDFFDDLHRRVQLDEFDVDEMLGDGDKVVVLGRERGTVRETGGHFETRFAHVFTLRNGKAVAAQIYTDTHAVAAAFGESTREREALTGPLGVTHPAYSGPSTQE
jgi:ketosteroid isomerase-like protein